MTLYSVILFVHITSALTLFAALSFEFLSLLKLRRATTIAEAQLWMEPAPRLPLLTGGSSLVVFLSGIYLVIQMAGYGLAWPKVTVASLLIIGPLSAITGRRMRAIRKACASENAITSSLLARLRDPILKISWAIRTAVFLGIVLLMVAKPELPLSLTIIAASVVLGLVSSLLISRRTVALSVPGAGLRG
jgi:hypothetical protein